MTGGHRTVVGEAMAADVSEKTLQIRHFYDRMHARNLGERITRESPFPHIGVDGAPAIVGVDASVRQWAGRRASLDCSPRVLRSQRCP